MGTSTSFPTPKGGDWTPLKSAITGYLGGSDKVSPQQIVGGTINAAGGLATPTLPRAGGSNTGSRSGGGGGGGGGGRGGGSRGGGGGGAGSRTGGRASIGRAVSGLGGFGAAVRDGGLDAGLAALGLQDLVGKPAAEVIARIAEHLAADTEGIQKELLSDALRQAILDAAALQGETGYADLGAALEGFLATEGVEGLVVSFLSNYVYDRVWAIVENHVDHKADTNASSDGLAAAVEGVCRSEVRSLVTDVRAEGRFDQVNWFGRGGQELGQSIVSDLQGRLTALDTRGAP